MKKPTLFLFLALLFGVARLHADSIDYINTSAPYLQAYGGVNFVQTAKKSGIRPHFNTGYVASGSFGYYWRQGVALEAEYSFRKNTLHSLWFYGLTFQIPGHYKSCSYMANFIWYLPVRSFMRATQLYLGVGIGYDVQHMRAYEYYFLWKNFDKGFAWQVLTGLGYALSTNTSLEVKYQFHKGPLKDTYIDSLGISFTYKFGSKKPECKR